MRIDLLSQVRSGVHPADYPGRLVLELEEDHQTGVLEGDVTLKHLNQVLSIVFVEVLAQQSFTLKIQMGSVLYVLLFSVESRVLELRMAVPQNPPSSRLIQIPDYGAPQPKTGPTLWELIQE